MFEAGNANIDAISGQELSPKKQLSKEIFGTAETNRIFIDGLLNEQEKFREQLNPVWHGDNIEYQIPSANINAYCSYLIHNCEIDKAVKVIEENYDIFRNCEEWSNEFIYSAVRDFLVPTGQLKAAKRICELLKDYDTLWQFLYAKVLVQLGEHQKAIEVYDEVNDYMFDECLVADAGETLIYLRALIGNGEINEATDFCDGPDLEYQFTLAKALLNEGEHQKLAEIIENIRDDKKSTLTESKLRALKTASLVKQGRPEEALERWRELDGDIWTQESADSKPQIFDRELHDGDLLSAYYEARILTGEEDKIFCEDIDSLIELSRAYRRLGKTEEERQAINEILVTHPNIYTLKDIGYELLVRCKEFGDIELMKKCAVFASKLDSDDTLVNNLMLRGVYESEYPSE